MTSKLMDSKKQISRDFAQLLQMLENVYPILTFPENMFEIIFRNKYKNPPFIIITWSKY